MKTHSQRGIAHLGLLLLVVIVAVIGYVGYKVANNKNKPVSTSGATASTVQVPAIKTSADLDKAINYLDGQNLDTGLNPDSLNSDITSLL